MKAFLFALFLIAGTCSILTPPEPVEQWGGTNQGSSTCQVRCSQTRCWCA